LVGFNAMNWFWLAAAGMAFLTFAIHTFVGTGFAVPPLRAATAHVPIATVWLNYLCWHIVTGVLLLLAFGFLAVGAGLADSDVAILCTASFGCVSVVSVSATLKGGIAVHRFPASYLGATTAALGLAGFVL
jgi:hypothetical protein